MCVHIKLLISTVLIFLFFSIFSFSVLPQSLDKAKHIQYLIEKSESNWGAIAKPAREELKSLGPGDEYALPYLKKALKSKDPGTRCVAALAIQRIEPTNTEGFDFLINELKNQTGTDYYPGDALVELGARSIPYLVSAIPDDRMHITRAGIGPVRSAWDTRALAIRALAKIGPSAVPALIEALRSNDPRMRLGAANILGMIGLEAKDAIPALIAAINDGNAAVRLNVYGALASTGKGNPKARSALIKARNKWFWRVFYTREFIPMFVDHLGEPEYKEIQRAIDELDGIDRFKRIKPNDNK